MSQEIDLDQQIGNGFIVVRKTYEFIRSFLQNLDTQLSVEASPSYQPLAEKGSFTKRSRGYEKTDSWYARAIGQFYLLDEEYSELKSGSRENIDEIEIQFSIFRLSDKTVSEKLKPEIIWGELYDLDINQVFDRLADGTGTATSYQFLRPIVNELYPEIDGQELTNKIEGKIRCNVDPISKWASQNDKEQEKLIEQFADNLINYE